MPVGNYRKIRRGLLGLGCVVFVLAVVSVSSLVGDDETVAGAITTNKALQVVTKPSRVYAPARPYVIDIDKYIKRSDPKAAAEALYQEAIRHGVDLDSIPNIPIGGDKKYRFSIPMEGARITPPGFDASFLSRLDSLQASGGGEERLVFILQLNRFMSVNETIALLRKGVRVYGRLGRTSFLARLTVGSMLEVLRLPYMRWAGEYRAEYKYEPGTESIEEVLVFSFEGEKKEFRTALEGVGSTMLRAYPNHYYVRVKGERVTDIAKFWWVKEIVAVPVAGIDTGAEPVVEDFLQAPQNLDFHPADSRDLINGNVGIENGAFVVVGVLDNGCQYSHTAITTKVSGLSDPPSLVTPYHHGTHVSGIIVGSLEDVSGLDIMGVAGGARIHFKRLVGLPQGTGTLDRVRELRSQNVRISNHSYGFFTTTRNLSMKVRHRVSQFKLHSQLI